MPTTYCQLPTANCLLPTAYCLPPTAHCLLPTANCLLRTAYCQLRTAYCLLPTLLILTFFAATALSQSEPHLDSLEIAISLAEGTHKADLKIESIYYQNAIIKKLGGVLFLNASQDAYHFSKDIQYKKGMAEAAIFLSHAYGSLQEPDSADSYLAEALNIFLEINDSSGIARTYGWLSCSERGKANLELAMVYAEKEMVIAEALNSLELLMDAYGKYTDIFSETGDFINQERYYMKILEIQEDHKLNPSNTFIWLARFYLNHGDYKKGIKYSMLADSAMGGLEDRLVPEYRDRKFMQAKMKGEVARAYRLWGYYDSALVWHRKAVAEMEAAPLHAGVDIPNQWEGIGYVYTQKGIYDSARIYLEKSASRRYELNDFLGAGESYDGLGYLCWLLGDEAGAVKYYADAIEMKSGIEKRVGLSRWVTLLVSQSVSYLQLGQVYASWGIYESALQNFEKSDSLCKVIGFRKGEAEALTEIGKLNGSAGDITGADRLLKEALAIFTEIDYKPGQANVLLAFGDVYFHLNQPEKALQFYNQAEEVMQKVENPSMMVDVLLSTGQALADMKKYEDAQRYLMAGLAMTEKYHLFRRNMKVNMALAGLYSHQGNERTALVYYSRYLAVRDSVNRQKTYYLLADLQSKHQSELNQRRLDLLGRESQVKELVLSRTTTILFSTFGLGLILAMILIMILRTTRLKAARRELLLEQKLFRSKMSPGFISYSLNNVKEMVIGLKSSQASDYITHFSRLMQSILEGSRKQLVPLKKGIGMVKNYFALMKLSDPENFDYEIIIDETIDQEEIMVPSFLEEVVFPGFQAERSNRFVKINIKNMGEMVRVTVAALGSVGSDDGLSSREADALKVIPSRLKEMERKYKMKLEFSIRDVNDRSLNLRGKQIEFTLPAISE